MPPSFTAVIQGTRRMKTLKQPFILFFVAGMVPTAEERIAAGKLRARIGMRNASAVRDEDVAEPCDGVAGMVPKAYEKFPTAEQAIADYDKRLDEAAKKAEAAVGKPPAAKPPAGPGPGKAPQGFENLPGGDGSLGAPNASGATPPAAVPGSQEKDGKPADAPTADANQKPAAWGSNKPK